MHQGKVRFICVKCKKGFNMRIGMENHKNKCMEGEEGAEDVVSEEKRNIKQYSVKHVTKHLCLKTHSKSIRRSFMGQELIFLASFVQVLPKLTWATHLQTFNSILKDALVIQIELYCTGRYARISLLIGPRK